MIRLGYKYCPRNKTFYTDNHESENNVKYRIEFTITYLEELEPYCLRWHQINIVDLKQIFESFHHEWICNNDCGTKKRIVTIGKEKKVLTQARQKFLSEMTFDDLLKRGKVFDSGKNIEFHTDSISDLPYMQPLLIQDGQIKNFSGFQSHFRKDKNRRILILIGQDEAICKQYI